MAKIGHMVKLKKNIFYKLRENSSRIHTTVPESSMGDTR
jgi:hypothetical protein